MTEKYVALIEVLKPALKGSYLNKTLEWVKDKEYVGLDRIAEDGGDIKIYVTFLSNASFFPYRGRRFEVFCVSDNPDKLVAYRPASLNQIEITSQNQKSLKEKSLEKIIDIGDYIHFARLGDANEEARITQGSNKVLELHRQVK